MSSGLSEAVLEYVNNRFEYLSRASLPDQLFTAYGAEQELLLLKQQKMAIAAALERECKRHWDIRKAYISTIHWALGFQMNGFRSYYALRGRQWSTRNTVEKYCHVVGWTERTSVKCAELVPRTLDSAELSYLFGVRASSLSEAHNGSLGALKFTWDICTDIDS